MEIPKKEIPLTRQQRRYKERIEKEASDTLRKLVNKFYETFMECDPDDPQIEHKRKELSAKWKMHCKKDGLVPSALVLFDDAAKAIIEKYKSEVESA